MARVISDRDVAALTIFGEAEGETYAGKLAVAEVIRNRMARHYTSDGTPIGTCLANRQFSCWNSDSGSRARMLRQDTDFPLLQDCYKAWDEAIAGSNTVTGAVLYLNPRLTMKVYGKLPLWADPSKRVATIGGHDFFSA